MLYKLVLYAGKKTYITMLRSADSFPAHIKFTAKSSRFLFHSILYSSQPAVIGTCSSTYRYRPGQMVLIGIMVPLLCCSLPTKLFTNRFADPPITHVLKSLQNEEIRIDLIWPLPDLTSIQERLLRHGEFSPLWFLNIDSVQTSAPICLDFCSLLAS